MPQSKSLNGKEVAEEIRVRLRDIVTQYSLQPQLAIVQVGARTDSAVYIRGKIAFADSVGVKTVHIQLPASITQTQIEEQIQKLNQDPAIHGIICQLPFESDSPLNSHSIINRIAPGKDVDGLTAFNAGKLLEGKLGDCHLPPTPAGCLELIRKSEVPISGARAVVVGRSQLIGSPMAQLLIWNDATVTVSHSKTQNLAEICRTADILVVAIGQPGYIKQDWIKPGAVVIDCGLTSVPDASRKSGQRLSGDADFEPVSQVAGFITPVPGGVGPMTIAMLIANTVNAAKRGI